jgi:hypothetical protein
MTAVCALLVGTATVENHARAMTGETVASPEVTGVADISMLTNIDGIQIWTRIMELGRQEGFSRLAQTMFVPSDAAFMSLPAGELSKLLTPGQHDLRRAFLARAATDAWISPRKVAGKRVSITTLDGRPLTIDATGGELMVGDAEAIDVQTLPDGRVIYVLDQPSMD